MFFLLLVTNSNLHNILILIVKLMYVEIFTFRVNWNLLILFIFSWIKLSCEKSFRRCFFLKLLFNCFVDIFLIFSKNFISYKKCLLFFLIFIYFLLYLYPCNMNNMNIYIYSDSIQKNFLFQYFYWYNEL